MLSSHYVFADSWLHRAQPLSKLLGLLLLGTTLLLSDSAWILLIAALAVCAATVSAQIPTGLVWRTLKPTLWVLVMIFAVQWWLTGLLSAAYVTLRFVTLISAASLLTFTTKISDFMAAIERGLALLPKRRWAMQISLAISLCFRFIPMLQQIASEVREAQFARGRQRDIKALVVPMVVRTLKNADDIADAIYARSPMDNDK